MSRDAEAEASLRKRLVAMLASAGESDSVIAEVIVGDRDSNAGHVNFRYDTEWFAVVKTCHTRRAHRAYGGFASAQGYSPQDASDQLVEALRRGAGKASEEAKRDAADLISDAIAFKRMAAFEAPEP